MSDNAEFTHHPSTPRRPDEKKPPKLRRYDARKWWDARANAASKKEGR